MKPLTCSVLLMMLVCPLFPHSDSGEYRDLINLKHTPLKSQDAAIRAFSDRGSWAGYGLSDKERLLSGFTGPYLSTNGKYLSPSFAVLFIRPHPGKNKIAPVS